jgi:hypothetical protein
MLTELRDDSSVSLGGTADAASYTPPFPLDIQFHITCSSSITLHYHVAHRHVRFMSVSAGRGRQPSLTPTATTCTMIMII